MKGAFNSSLICFANVIFETPEAARAAAAFKGTHKFNARRTGNFTIKTFGFADGYGFP